MKRSYSAPETERFLLEPDEVICTSRLAEESSYAGEEGEIVW